MTTEHFFSMRYFVQPLPFSALTKDLLCHQCAMNGVTYRNSL